MSRNASRTPRPYTKRNNAYWEARSAASQFTSQPVNTAASMPPVPFPDVTYGGVNLVTGSDASVGSLSRSPQANSGGVAMTAFQNLKGLPLPYTTDRDRGVGSIHEAVDLCVRAWTNVAAVRNAVEVAVEFSNQPFFVRCKNKTVKKYFEEWIRVVVNRLTEQFFREYYRSGNVFILRFDGKFDQSSTGRIPIRYEVLNPSNVYAQAGLTTAHSYVQFLSKYEIEKLRNPVTPQDRQVFQSLPAEIRKQITEGGAVNGIYIPIDPARLRYAFYKKQNYEAMAVPMVWPVLPDIEWKLMLKKYDKALAQSVEHILLLITTGDPPNEWNKGNGINVNNIARLQAMFHSQALMRVLVADHSTKAEWKVPSLEGLNPQKYQIVNEDIREGLQSILVGDDKFANAQMKATVFVQRLQEGQRNFLEGFLQLEVDRICADMSFRDKPIIGFRKINMKDEAMMGRIITQLAQLGILTAPQTVKTLETNVLPDEDEMDEAQDQYIKDREKGKYFPLVGGSQKEDGEAGGASGRPAGTSGIKQSTKSVGPIGTSKATVTIPRISLAALVDATKKASELEMDIAAALKRKYKVKGDLNEAQAGIVHALAKTVMANHPKAEWLNVVKAAVAAPQQISTDVAEEIEELREKFGLQDDYSALLARVSLL